MDTEFLERIKNYINEGINKWNDICKNVKMGNLNEKGRIVFCYMLAEKSYIDGIYMLLRMNNPLYDSIIVITRAFVENFAVLHRFFENYEDDDKFNEIYNEVIITDMQQDMNILKNINDSALEKTYLNDWNKAINNRFADAPEFNQGGEITFEMINSWLKSKKRYNISENIANALSDNKIKNLLGYKENEIKTIYPILCRFTHNNISSITNRTINREGFWCYNSDEYDGEASLELDVAIFKYIIQRFKGCCLDD